MTDFELGDQSEHSPENVTIPSKITRDAKILRLLRQLIDLGTGDNSDFGKRSKKRKELDEFLRERIQDPNNAETLEELNNLLTTGNAIALEVYTAEALVAIGGESLSSDNSATLKGIISNGLNGLYYNCDPNDPDSMSLMDEILNKTKEQALTPYRKEIALKLITMIADMHDSNGKFHNQTPSNQDSIWDEMVAKSVLLGLGNNPMDEDTLLEATKIADLV